MTGSTQEAYGTSARKSSSGSSRHGYGVPSRWVYPRSSAIISMSGYVQRSCGSVVPISSTFAGRPDLFTR
jgi:hypothetical protein